jgi:hypothetical protein
MLGNSIGWANWDNFTANPPEVGANNHVFGAFDPDIMGKSPFNRCQSSMKERVC